MSRIPTGAGLGIRVVGMLEKGDEHVTEPLEPTTEREQVALDLGHVGEGADVLCLLFSEATRHGHVAGAIAVTPAVTTRLACVNVTRVVVTQDLARVVVSLHGPIATAEAGRSYRIPGGKRGAHGNLRRWVNFDRKMYQKIALLSRLCYDRPNMTDEKAIAFHKQYRGKIETGLKAPLQSPEDLALAYTPGVGAVSTAIAEDHALVNELTNRGNTVAIVSDGSAVLGLGNIGPEAAMAVMEGKAAIFKQFGNVDAVPICLNTQNTDEIVAIVRALEPTFGGINLEDIAAPRCFEIEEQLKATMGIPVFHDDQHGTATVVLAGLLNALTVTNRDLSTVKIVISGAGAAGIAITKLLLHAGATDITLTDSKGVISKTRTDLNDAKLAILSVTNPRDVSGTLEDALRTTDVFIGVSGPGVLNTKMVQSMNAGPIIFALANPVPEIMPDEAKAGGAAVVATGRSDFPNQVNNALVFPGLFRGLFDAQAKNITPKMLVAAAHALAALVPKPTTERILPGLFEEGIVPAIAEAVKKYAK